MLSSQTHIIHQRVTKLMSHSTLQQNCSTNYSIRDNKKTALGAHIAWNKRDNSHFQQLVITYLWLWFEEMYLQAEAAKRWCPPPHPLTPWLSAIQETIRVSCTHSLEHEGNFYLRLFESHGWLLRISDERDRTISFSKRCFCSKWSEGGIWEFCSIERQCSLLTLNLETLF